MSHHDDQDYIIIERKRGGASAFLWGAAIGSGIALLLAPRSGRQIRADIRDGVTRLRDQAEDAVRGVQRSVNDRVSGVREDVRERMDAARSAFEAGREAARETRRIVRSPRASHARPAGPPLDQVADEDLDADV